jgi:DNA-binding LacI/PurR family transcriptional regulator
MRDVAQHLGVNASTVSRALRGDPRVSAETRKRVEKAAQELAYRPNPFVQAFTAHVRGYRRMPEHAPVAVLSSTNPGKMPTYTQLYAEGVEAQAQANGYKVNPFVLDGSPQQFERTLRILQTRGIQGLVVLPVEKGRSLPGLASFPMAMATIDYTLKSPSLHRATPSYFQNMDMALRNAWRLGYRRVGFCTYREEVERISSHWLGAFASWSMLQPPEQQIPVHFSEYAGSAKGGPEGDALWRSYRRQFRTWLDTTKPDVIISNDTFILEWLVAEQFRVPEQVGFIHLGLNPERPELSGIDQNHREIGAAAMDLVLAQIHSNQYGVPLHMKTVLVYGKWVEGTTTKKQQIASENP